MLFSSSKSFQIFPFPTHPTLSSLSRKQKPECSNKTKETNKQKKPHPKRKKPHKIIYFMFSY